MSFPEFAEHYKRAIRDPKLETITDKAFRRGKLCILSVSHLMQNVEMEEDDRKKLVQLIIDNNLGRVVEILKSQTDHSVNKPKTWLSWFSSLTSSSPVQQLQTELQKHAAGKSDRDFLSSLRELVAQEPLLEPAASDAIKAAHSYFAKEIRNHSRGISHRARSAQENMAKAQIGRELAAALEEKQNAAKLELIQKIATGSQSTSSPRTAILDSVEITGRHTR